VRIWFADLRAGPEQVGMLAEPLDQEERERAERIRYAEGRRRFIVAHAFLRQVLGYHLDLPARCVQFRYAPRGKPALAQGNALDFSLSHSYDAAAVAVADGRRVGIDLEVMRDSVDFEGLARRYFCHPEAERVACSPDFFERRSSFYFHWTGKEAYLKAQGDGLFAPLDSFEVIPEDSGLAPRLRIDDPREHGRWSIQLTRPAPDIACAVVAEGSNWRAEAATWLPLGGPASPEIHSSV
jgi:4'-phosphopantetheinyl transferase